MFLLILFTSYFLIIRSTLMMVGQSISPSTALSYNTNYQFNFTTTNSISIPVNSTFVVSFPSSFNITYVSNCQMTLNSASSISPTCTVDSSNNYVIFSGFVSSSVSLTDLAIIFNTSGAIYSSNPIVTFYFNDNTSTVISDSILTTSFVISVNTLKCNITTNSPNVGANSTWTFSVTPNVSTLSTQIIQVVLPLWGPYNVTNFYNTPTCTSNCTTSLSSANQILSLSNMFSGNSTASFNFNVSAIKNPSSTYPTTLTIYIKTSNFNTIQSCTTTVSATSPNTFKVVSFPVSNYTILGSNTVALSIIPFNPLPASNSYISLVSTLPITYIFNASALSNSSNRPTQITTTDGSVIIGNLTSSNINTFYSLGSFIVTNPPSIKPVGITITTLTVVGSSYYSIDSSVVYLTANYSIITTASIGMNTTNAYKLSKYVISFNNINPLVASSYILVYIPTQVTVNSSTTCSSAFGSCLVNTSYVNTTVTNPISAGSNISITINNVLNPLLTISSSTFSIYTYYDGANALVDQLTSGLTVLSTSNPIVTANITPSSFVINAITLYTFKISFTNIFIVGTIINITFPTQIPLSMTVGFDSSNTLSCSISQSSQIISLSSCSTTNLTGTITLILNNVRNPVSTKPTSTFNITSFYNNSILQYLSSSLGVTMTTGIPFSSASISATNSTITALTTYTFIIAFSITHYSGYKLILTLPSEITASNIVCTSLYGTSSISCSQSSQTITIVMSFASFPTNATISFSISGITNNFVPKSSTVTIQSYTNDTVPYLIQTGSATVSFSSGFIGASAASDNNIILLSNSTLKITISPTFSLSSVNSTSLYIYLILPFTQFTVINSCTVSYGVCTYSSSLNGYNITSISTFSSQIVVQVKATTAYFSGSSNPLNITLFYNLNSTTYILASNNILSIVPYCNSPCGQCSTSPTLCLTCLTSSYTTNTSYFASNYSCLAVCPNSYYLNTSVCSACSVSCYTCYSTSTNCTQCNNNTYLLNNTCNSSCPTYYYSNSSTWICQSCVSPCSTCSNSTYCLTCVTNYYYYQGTCNTTCSVSNMIPYQGICTSCSSTCATCYSSLNNCTTCISNLLLFNNSCVNSCPSYTYSNSSTCIACVSPCSTCTSDTVCTSCVSSQVMYQTTCINSCPSGYISIAAVCNQCNSSCLTCSQLINNCTSCSSNLFQYGTNCLSSCPVGVYPYQGQCVVCVSPCSTCTGYATNCTTCVNGTYLYNNTCITTCPSGYYLENTTSSCLSCGTCLICSSLTNCTACFQNNYLLGSMCYTSCPPAYPVISGQTCLNCDTNCFTCSINTNNCTSCYTNKYLFRYTCLQTCPIGLYTNKIANTCDNDLLQKIIFFPFLISALVISLVICFSRLHWNNTALVTALVAGFSLPELGVFVFYTVLITTDQQGVNLSIPLYLAIGAIGMLVLLSIVYYIINVRNIRSDEYYQVWINTEHHYPAYMFFSCLSLFTFKLYRIIYCRLFNISSLSMICKSQKCIFPQTTIITLVSTFISSLVMGVSAIIVIYLKEIKDQVFYTTVECLLVTVIMIILTLLDIHKDQDFFNQSEYMITKKYVQKVKDSKTKQQECSIYDAPSIGLQSQQGFGTGGKTFYKKTNDVFMFEDNSAANIKIDDSESEMQTIQLQGKKLDFNSLSSNKKKPQQTSAQNQSSATTSKRRINIFDSIQEDQAEYQQQHNPDSDEEAIKEGRRRLKSQEKIDQAQEVAAVLFQDDAVSVIQGKQLKNKWNDIIGKRKQQAKKLISEKQIFVEQQIPEQKLQQQQEQIEQIQIEPETLKPPSISQIQMESEKNLPQLDPEISQRQTQRRQDDDIIIRKRKRIKVTKSMKQTQLVYLQRLTAAEQVQLGKRSSKKKNRRKSNDLFHPDF